MVTRLWDHNLQSIDPSAVEIAIDIEFTGVDTELFEQSSGCDLSTKVYKSHAFLLVECNSRSRGINFC